MMAKIVKGKSFKGVINYVLDKAKQTELLVAEGVRYKSRESIIRSFITQTGLNPKVSKTVGHISLDFSVQDNGSTEIGYSPAHIIYDDLQPNWGWFEYPVSVSLYDFSLTLLQVRGTYRIYPVNSENLSSPYRPYIFIKGTDNSDKYVTITILSDNADLSSLSVNGYPLSPNFSSNTTDYVVTVPNSVTSRTISATAAESHATVSGTGEKTLIVGDNLFNIAVTADAGNTKTYTIVITREATTDIANALANQLQIFPNPTKDEIFIKSDLQIEKVEISSVAGTLLISETNFVEKISVSALPHGVYLLKVYTDKGVAVSKIVKE